MTESLPHGGFRARGESAGERVARCVSAAVEALIVAQRAGFPSAAAIADTFVRDMRADPETAAHPGLPFFQLRTEGGAHATLPDLQKDLEETFFGKTDLP